MQKECRLLILVMAALAASTGSAAAQSQPGCSESMFLPAAPLGSASEELARLNDLSGLTPYQSRLARRWSTSSSLRICSPSRFPWQKRTSSLPPENRRLELLPLHSRLSANTAYPRDQNNGAVWSGRGAAAEVTGGVRLRWRGLSAGFAPSIAFQENRDFEMRAVSAKGYSPFIYSGHPGDIDWPQRFGTESYWTLDLGQSYIRAQYRALTAGISTENLWWGPAQRNPILLSNTAPGFPHVTLGSARPVDIGLAHFEMQAFWGRADESDFFDADPGNNERLFQGLIMILQPDGLPGLYVGGARVYHETIPPGGIEFERYLSLFELPFSDYFGNQPGNGIASLFARWVLPESGFEAYFEWAREDYAGNLDDLLKEPDHTQAYTLGFQKLFAQRDHWWRVYGELTHLGQSVTFRSGRGFFSYYTGGAGHTHRGQLLGAAIGPGSDAQFLGTELYTANGRIGAYVERVRHDDDAYYTTWSRYYGETRHDVELTAGVHQLLFLGDFDLQWSLAYSHRYNRNFIGLDGANWRERVDRNWQMLLGLGWHVRPRPAHAAD